MSSEPFAVDLFGSGFAKPVVTNESMIIVDSQPGILMGAGTIANGPIVDVRQHSSYYLQATASGHVQTTNYDPVSFQLEWFADPNGTELIYTDVIEIWAFQSLGGAATPSNGKLLAQDSMHGPYMRLRLYNHGVDSVDVTYNLRATTRQLPGPYFRETSLNAVTEDVTCDNYALFPTAWGPLGIGATQTITGVMRYGRCRLRATSNSGVANNTILSIVHGSLPVVFESFFIPATNEVFREMIFPKRPMKIDITNNTGAGNLSGLITCVSENAKF